MAQQRMLLFLSLFFFFLLLFLSLFWLCLSTYSRTPYKRGKRLARRQRKPKGENELLTRHDQVTRSYEDVVKIVVMEIEGGRQYSLYSVCEADRATPGKSRGPKKETNKTRCRSPSDGRFGEGGEKKNGDDQREEGK